MKKSYILLLPSLILSGCGALELRHKVDISEMQPFLEFNVNNTVSIVNGQPNKDRLVFLDLGVGVGTGNKHAVTQTVVDVATLELTKRRAIILEQSEKQLSLSVDNLDCEQADPNSITVICETVLHMQAGNGYEAYYTARGESIDANDSLSYSLANSVSAMFRDLKVIEYLTSK